ncbi:hypothetical protein GCM10010129_42880 [Streptomyces fumigatiscleroticus]|nr:hypothetical protein GCM10010129_42880 [Streptomyces fumigatiscleroticus]
MTPWFVTVFALLAGALAMVLVRLRLGPSMLDRAVAVDTLLSVAVAAIGTLAAQQRNGYFLPILLVLSFLGFTGSVSIARFISVPDRKGRPGTGEGGKQKEGQGEGEGEGQGEGQGEERE